jgi:hypothetical protein
MYSQPDYVQYTVKKNDILGDLSNGSLLSGEMWLPGRMSGDKQENTEKKNGFLQSKNSVLDPFFSAP